MEKTITQQDIQNGIERGRALRAEAAGAFGRAIRDAFSAAFKGAAKKPARGSQHA